MIPLAKILELRKKRSAAVACDAADDTECTKDDPTICRIHGKKALAETDAEDKSKHSHVNPYGGKPMSVDEAILTLLKESPLIVCPNADKTMEDDRLTQEEKDAAEEAKILFDDGKEVDFGKSVTVLGETFAWMRKQFPNIRIPRISAFIIAKPKRETSPAVTFQVEHEESHARYNAIGFSATDSSVPNDYSFNHGDFRNDYDYARHEIGHLIAINEGVGDSQFFQSVVEEIGEDAFAKEMAKVSKCAMRDIPHGEALAECFSLYTSPDYDGSLDDEIESFIKVMLTGEEEP